MNKTHILEDPQNGLDELLTTLDILPFKESVYAYFVSICDENDSQITTIMHYINLDSHLFKRTMSSATIDSRAIIAALKLAQNINCSILIAHTHPRTSYFPPECEIYDHGGFSKEDWIFMDKLNCAFNRMFSTSTPIYYLVTDGLTYCALEYAQGQYTNISVPKLEKMNILQTRWEV